MRPFLIERASTEQQAVSIAARVAGSDLAADRPFQFLAGGTTLIDLMKLDVMRPATLIDVNGIRTPEVSSISLENGVLRLGSLVRMAHAADHNAIKSQFPVIAESLALAASAQLRNMASLGGNALQRTRCPYFRDFSYRRCNKRVPGSGCSAMDGVNRLHAVLGVSNDCIAAYPGDFSVALIALDATVEIAGPNGTSKRPFADLHRAPGATPQIETTLAPGDFITTFVIPATPYARRSRYVKVRDRQSYEFALASAAIVLDMDGGIVREARIALGGVATTPWRARDAEAALKGRRLDETTAQAAAEIAFNGASAREHNAFKIPLGKATVVRALLETAALGIAT